jgi:hypothetical protein
VHEAWSRDAKLATLNSLLGEPDWGGELDWLESELSLLKFYFGLWILSLSLQPKFGLTLTSSAFLPFHWTTRPYLPFSGIF